VQLAGEIEAVPNFGVDIWTMRRIDQKCQVIRGDCAAISRLVGTGDVLHHTLPPGMMPITSQAAMAAQLHLQRIGVLAQAIEDVPNFGADIWTMRQIDVECREMAWHAQAVWPLVSPPGTGHV
jgi:hypothetical protein